MDTEQIEQQMRATRARIDYKLDLLSARTDDVRRQTPLILGALVGIVALLALINRRRKRHVGRQRRRHAMRHNGFDRDISVIRVG